MVFAAENAPYLLKINVFPLMKKNLKTIHAEKQHEKEVDKLPRKNKKARERIVGKRIKDQGGIEVQQPAETYKIRGDIYPGRIAAVAWPREVKL